MTPIFQVTRRDFLAQLGIGAGALVLGTSLPGISAAAVNAQPNPSAAALGYFVSLSPDGAVNIICHRMEMGQGINTSVPQIIADEMEADWSRVTVSLGKADARYGDQSTGGSASIRKFFTHIRQMGAIARDMLEQAAANRWKVEKSAVKAQQHFVVNTKTGEKIAFGDLAADAAKLPVPNADWVKLKSANEFKLIGKDVKLIGHQDIVQGKAVYAQDIQLPGMLIASIERPPVVGGKVKKFDATEAKKVAGVVDVIKLKDRPLPVDARPVSGVAVLATNTWAAIEGRKKLKVEWDLGSNADHNSATYKQALTEKVQQPGKVVRGKGKIDDHQYNPERTVEAVYTMPYHHHMSMETPAATAIIKDGKCTVWTGTQTPQWGKGLILGELGLDPQKDGDKVEVNTTLMGGAFGRKGKNDFTLEAVELAKVTGKPVKVIWSREDDVRHGFYHSIAANYCKAEINEKKSADFWVQRVAHPPIGWTFDGKSDIPADMLLQQGFADIPFVLNNFSCEVQPAPAHVRIGWFRAVQNLHNAFALSCFVDELAVKAGISTRQMWLNLLGEDRIIDPRKEGFTGWTNYDQLNDDHAVDTRRMKQVINTVADKAKIEQKLPAGEAWGIAYSNSFNSYSAAATKVRVKDKKVEVLEMHTAIDCGLAITPDRVRSQMEGAMIMGLSIALSSQITIKNGAIEQSNFHDYPVSRMPEVPPLHVHLIPSNHAPGGVGEPGLPAVIPSIINAIYHASGIRIRDLPAKNVLTV
ncbi:xanthine dehydrogenase family protein molybdopterin-binding subunit [Saccharophagus sp. K07]|uniref:xanthine dehydrogenase family protein molybdopterin-binding subunit n=1 Tax=Saccharophagus sp. K07 TaxID=2283636 RepID=UPI00165239B3|nr:molybdopterin cofactor-binding domain-containing protein [Saccharophagus sp. K07]MBC6905485.1 xanthine dehydrogenase family protein molybdopterin-binding subunit [Saccharophagus sp. K07]